MTTMRVRQQTGAPSRTRRWTPLMGLAAVIGAIVSFVLVGEPPDAGSPVSEIVDYYTDKETAIWVGWLVTVGSVVLLVFFAAYLRSVLGVAAGAGEMLPTLMLIGATVFGVGVAIDSTISIALTEAVDDVEPAAVQALQALWDNDFVPMQLGILLFLIAVGLSVVRHASLPKWLGWVALGLAAAGFTPVGFAAFFGFMLWIAVVSVLLAVRGEPARR